MSAKVRRYEDFAEVGSYLALVHLALVHAGSRLQAMYPEGSGVVQRLGDIAHALDNLRRDLDGRWMSELTDDMGNELREPAHIAAHLPQDRDDERGGPAGPIFGPESREALAGAFAALDSLARLGVERDLGPGEVQRIQEKGKEAVA